MTTPPSPPADSDGRLLRLECPHCKAETPLWFRPDETGDETLTRTEWEAWLDAKCRECGKTPREPQTR
jgi:ribosomal protein S27E